MSTPYREKPPLVPMPPEEPAGHPYVQRPFEKDPFCPFCGEDPKSGPPCTCYGKSKTWWYRPNGVGGDGEVMFVKECAVKETHLHQYCTRCKGSWYYRTAEQEKELRSGAHKKPKDREPQWNVFATALLTPVGVIFGFLVGYLW